MRRKLALVVGNNSYTEPYSRLSHAVEDASVVAGFLRHRLEFDVVSLYNKTASDVDKTLLNLVRSLTNDSLFFFYFAGHGLCVGNSQKQSLLCVDASELLLEGVGSAPGAISPGALAAISRMGRGDMFFCLDVCRTQTLRQKGGPEIQRGGAGLRDAVTRPNGKQGSVRGRRLTLSSCADGQGANDDGAFANALVSEMKRLLDAGCELKLDDNLVEAVEKRLQCGQTPVLDGERFVLVSGTPKRPIASPISDSQEAAPPFPEPPTPPKTALQLTTEANAALQSGRYDEAERLADEALRLDPSFGWATYVLTEARKKLEERREKERRSRELDHLLNEGWICLNNGEAKLALAKATAVLKERPNDSAARELKRLAEAALQTDATSIWSPSTIRVAGYRQTLQIGSQKYGFVWIPSGEFDMGSPTSEKDRFDDEKLHHVKLTKGFWALETETPQALYQEVMGENPSEFKGADLPVENVSWDEAMKFCKKLTKRLPKGLKATLPTEAQWEYMARAETKTAYWYGNAPDSSKMNYGDNVGKTTPVKSYAPNPWGLYDVHGNVWEWTSDHYGDYPSGTVTDPKGPTSASNRVIRGGYWRCFAGNCRSANRYGDSPDDRDDDLGFRFLLVCD